MRLRIHLLVIALMLFAAGFMLRAAAPRGEENWPGVDKTVVEKVAKEHGREAKEPLINTDRGDLLLFLFLIAGAAGGFAAGYYWRVLVERKPDNRV